MEHSSFYRVNLATKRKGRRPERTSCGRRTLCRGTWTTFTLRHNHLFFFFFLVKFFSSLFSGFFFVQSKRIKKRKKRRRERIKNVVEKRDVVKSNARRRSTVIGEFEQEFNVLLMMIVIVLDPFVMRFSCATVKIKVYSANGFLFARLI